MSQARQAIFAIRRVDKWWFVGTPDESRLGPFLPTVALQVALTHALLARKRGVDARIFVCDDYGETHHCPTIEEMNDPDRCQRCECSWQPSALPVRCALHAAINSGA